MGKGRKRASPLAARERRFAALLATLRRARGLSQAALAEQCRLSVDTISRLERGTFSPTLETLFKLADGMRISLSTVLLAFERLERDAAVELAQVARSLEPAEADAALRVLVVLAQLLRGTGEDAE